MSESIRCTISDGWSSGRLHLRKHSCLACVSTARKRIRCRARARSFRALHSLFRALSRSSSSAFPFLSSFSDVSCGCCWSIFGFFAGDDDDEVSPPSGLTCCRFWGWETSSAASSFARSGNYGTELTIE